MSTDSMDYTGSPMSMDGKMFPSAVQIDVFLDQSVGTLKEYPKEKKKTVIAFLFLCFSGLCVALSLALTHERLPDRNTKPLPDIFFDNVAAKEWALDVSDIITASSIIATTIVMLLHRHRWIVIRRACLLAGCLYLMKSITIYVTVLPVASYLNRCSPKSNSTSVLEVLGRVIKLYSSFGFTIDGQQTYCGNYIYSGHTAILVTTYLIIQEYTPRKLLILHWIFLIVSCMGVVMLLISRSHYTIDILIAYYVATRLFWIYHTLANNQQLKVKPSNQNGSSYNYLAKLWWFPVFRYMEENVGGTLPKRFSLPWSSEKSKPTTPLAKDAA